MSEDIKCILCNDSSRKVLENFIGYQEGEHFNIYYCKSCNTSFAWPHEVNDKIYDHIYSQSDVVPGYNRYALYAKEISSSSNALDYLAGKEAMYYSVREILGAAADKKIKILEVGSGLGYLTYAISQEGYHITGLDISADAVKKAVNKFGDHFICMDLFKYVPDHKEEFDFVILTEVIEHLPDPKRFCDALIHLLKKDGKLVITTPNKSAFPADEYWDTESPPVHLTWFSENSFRAIAEQKNLRLSFFDFENFNKKHIDAPRFKFYKSIYKRKNRDYTLNKAGEVIAPIDLTAKSGNSKLKKKSWNFIKSIIESFFIHFLTDKSNPSRNGILCVILQK